MTLIECFTEGHVDNIAACLRLRPEKLIFVGDVRQMASPVDRYKDLFRQRGLDTEITLCDANSKDFAQLQAAVQALILQAESCVIDLSGGDEPVILAMGAVLAGLDGEKRKTIRVERFDYKTQTVVDCISGYHREPETAVNLTVAEMVMLHGGKLYPDDFAVPADYSLREFNRLWQVASEMPRKWNEAVAQLKRFEKFSQDKHNIHLPLEVLGENIPDLPRKEMLVRELLDKLQRRGVIQDESSRYALRYTYNSEFLHHCIEKEGNVLEIKTLLEGRAATKDGKPLFTDCRMSADMDWDGIIPDSKYDFSGTRNEVDVVLMQGTIPLFISCKNGDVKTEELYKLHTVAARFGGPYAKKMLIATDLDYKEAAASRSFAQRAWDMDIFLVTDAAELTDREWQEIFLEAMQ